MVSLPRRLIPQNMLSLPKLIPKYYQPKTPSSADEQEEKEQKEPFIPFSEIQRRKLLESQLIPVLDSSSSLIQLKQVHGYIIRKGLDQCCFVLTKLLRILTNLNVPVDLYPRVIFEQVHFPNPFIYTALIRGYLIQGLLENAVSLYGEMRRNDVSPVSFTFTALFKTCSYELDVNLGSQFHGQCLKIGGFCQDLYVGNSLIDMHVKCGLLDDGRKIFDEMPERDVISWTTLIVAYAKKGLMPDALELFEKLPVKDMVAWTAMVTGFAQNAQPKEALKYFEKMQNAGVDADEVTLSSVISACAQLGASKYANWIRDVAERLGYGPTYSVLVGSAMIDMYSKCGNLEHAFNVFKCMHNRNVFSYSAMIVGFAMHGCAREALKLFDEMKTTEVRPNKVTFVGVLTACSHAGMVEQGKKIFEAMEKVYEVTPSEDHYGCMIDLLGRAGRLGEALDFIKTMPIEPNAAIWGALLGACRIHGNSDIAEIAASHLFELEPDGIGNYILLSTVYASAGRWKEVSRVRKSMKTNGLMKNPSCSMFEGEKGVIHEFYSNDMTHPMSGKIKQELKELLHRLGLKRYQPILSSVPYDVNDEDKKQILMTHSEKLALVYALLTTNGNTSITILKNLRICEDCHLFMCGASNFTGRVIIIRDNLRFHHFRNGACSCGNFW